MSSDRENQSGISPPAASVVTTVYNRQASLQRAMSSVLSQSFPDFEYIIVDDGSTDDSALIAESSGDRRVTVLRMPHKGRAAALNTAFTLCRGEFILIQDSDDVALPERFAKQIAFLRAHSEVGMVGCQLSITDEMKGKTRLLSLPSTHEGIRNLMPITSAVAFCCSCIRRSILSSSCPFDESMSAAEDFDFQLRHLSRTRFHNLDELLQQKFAQSDSMGHVQKTEQDQLGRDRSLRFLQNEATDHAVFGDPREVAFHQARVEYYYGNAGSARQQFLALLRQRPLEIRLYRYFLPTLLGNRLFSFLRRSGITFALTRPFRQFSILNRHFLP